MNTKMKKLGLVDYTYQSTDDKTVSSDALGQNDACSKPITDSGDLDDLPQKLGSLSLKRRRESSGSESSAHLMDLDHLPKKMESAFSQKAPRELRLQARNEHFKTSTSHARRRQIFLIPIKSNAAVMSPIAQQNMRMKYVTYPGGDINGSLSASVQEESSAVNLCMLVSACP